MTSLQYRLYSTFIPSGSVVFDVGANVGNRIDAFLQCGATVVAIEPQSDCVARLTAIYGDNPNVTIVQSAIGEMCDERVLYSAKAVDPAASMSDEWMDKTRNSGRFPKRNYQLQTVVRVTTLDHLIERFGAPSFIKIDVEGYEERVLTGLSTRVGVLSFEWTPEMPEKAIACMVKASNLGMTYFHISFSESMRFCHPTSTSRETIENLIRFLETESVLFGDIYASSDPLKRV